MFRKVCCPKILLWYINSMGGEKGKGVSKKGPIMLIIDIVDT